MTTASAALDPRLKSWRYRIFAASWLSYAGFYFCRKPFYIVKADLGDALNADAAMLGAIGTAYLVAYTIGQFVSGALGNRIGARVMLLVGMAGTIVVNMAFGFANSWATLTVLLFVNGLFQSTGWSNNVGAMAPWFRRKERGTVMGFWATNYQVGGVLANVMASFIAGALGFRYAFFGGAVVMMAVWVFFVFNQRNRPEDVGLAPLEDPDEEKATSDGGGWSRNTWTNVLLVGGFYFFLKFIRYALWSWAPYLLKMNFALSTSDAGYLSTTFDLAGIGGVIIAGVVSDRLFKGKRTGISFLFIVGMAVSCVVLYTVGSTSITAFAVSIGLVGFFLYGPDALLTGAGAIEVGSKRHAVLAAGIINGMGQFGAVAQELILGNLLDGTGGIDAVFGVLLVSSFGALASLSVLLVRNRSGKADL
jgi:sugar phosphate permease